MTKEQAESFGRIAERLEYLQAALGVIDGHVQDWLNRPAPPDVEAMWGQKIAACEQLLRTIAQVANARAVRWKCPDPMFNSALSSPSWRRNNLN
jgi:hypothetical protein